MFPESMPRGLISVPTPRRPLETVLKKKVKPATLNPPKWMLVKKKASEKEAKRAFFANPLQGNPKWVS